MTRIGVGIIGAGRIGRLHAEHLLVMPNIELVGISDVFITDDLNKWASKHGIETVTSDYMDLLKDPRITAVFICSPTSTHVEMIEQSARHTKHIFCEKPISFSYIETQSIMDVVKRHKVQFQVGFNRRFDENFRKVQELMSSGALGKPQIIKITSRDPEPPPPEYIRNSGGLFMDMSIHDFDMARYLAGSEVESVYAQGSVLIDPRIGELGDIDTAIITLAFTSGAMGVIDNSRKAVYGYDQRVEVFGSDGCAAADNVKPTTVSLSSSEGVLSDKPKRFFLDRYTASYVEEIRCFFEAITDDSQIKVTVWDGLQAERIAYAAKLSLQEKRVVRLSELN